MMYVMFIVYIFIGSQTTLYNYYNIVPLTPHHSRRKMWVNIL